MRLVISSESKKKLFNLLKEKYFAKSINELATKLNISKKTLQGWFYTDKTIPSKFVDNSSLSKIEILDRKEDNWGQIKGGKEGYKRFIKKYGLNGVKIKQSLGGKNAFQTKEKLQKPLNIDLEDPLFLEFYGSLLGDGWLSNFTNGAKKVWIIGLCGNLRLEKEYVLYCADNFKKLFNRKGHVQERLSSNVIQILFYHKNLVKYLNKSLGFPIGLKKDLKIHQKIYGLGFNKIKYVIRGIFDTDGSFYLDKNRKKVPIYPVISIHMDEPLLIKQIGDILEKEGFNFSYSNNGNQIKLKGNKQLKKWLAKIGSSNPYKLTKMQNAPVAQPG